MDDGTLQETVDYIALTRLQAAYADIVNRRAWRELAEIFLPDADVVIDTRGGNPIELAGPDALGEFIGSRITGFEFFEFVPLNTVINVGTDTATARLYMCELRLDRDSGRFTRAYGVYHDRYTRQAGQWQFASRRYHSLARTGADVLAFPFPDVSF